MRRFCIDSALLGTDRHIVGDQEGYVWSDSIPRDAWHLSGRIKSSPNALCLDSLFRLVNYVPTSPPREHVTAFKSLLTGSADPPVRWMYALPQEKFRIFFKNLVQETMDLFPKLPFDYYETAWAAGNRVLSRLRPARIDTVLHDTLIAEQEQLNPSLESFRPKRSGFAREVSYDRFSTRTGRLVVESGPNILHLKKDYRRIISSTFPGGSICSLDFRALEPRIVLAAAGRHSSAEDLYEELSKVLLQGVVQRDVVKVAVIAELYGVSRSTLRSKLGVSDKKLDAFIGVIRRHFGIDELRERLRSESLESGIVRNKFGRPLAAQQGQDNLLVNTFAQSTGVDVAMLGFDRVLDALGDDGIRPLFVLHDALILDVRPDRMNDVKGFSSVEVPSYDVPFPLKLDAL